MIAIDRTQGLTIRVKPDGMARFAPAAFITVWLCCWALGEVKVLGLLGNGAIALLTGHELNGNPSRLQAAPALGVGAFLLVWVTFWTIGGIAAMAELLRLVSSEETLSLDGDTIVIARRRGPFTWFQRLPRNAVRRVRVAPRRRMLVLETDRKSIEFAPVQSPADESQALDALRSALQLAAPDGSVALPDGWEETLTPEGERVVIRDTKIRRRQAFVLAGMATVAWAAALAFAWLGTLSEQAIGPAIIATVLAAGLGSFAWWLWAGRQEIKCGDGEVIVRRRWRGRVRDLYEARRLDLVTRADSDGDVWYRLEAISNAPLDARGTRKYRTRVLASAMNDPFEPRALGAWLAAHGGVPFDGGLT